jgi:O-antigen/teichoic acid export membrane protein
VQWLVLLLGAYQFFFRCNATLAAVLHARERVDGLSVTHVVTKCMWGGGLALVLLLGLPLPWLAAPILAAEVLKAGVLLHLARSHAGLKLSVDARATRLVLVAALPFFLNDAAIATNGKVDVTLLGIIASKTEVGWYGAAWAIAGMTMMVSPLLGWVLMPMLSRAAAQSQEELTRLIRRGLEGIISFSVPVTLALALGAETWVRLMFGEVFAPAAAVLRLLAPIFVLTYVATVSGSWLMAANRPWTVTATSVMSMALNPVLNLLLIPPMLKELGTAGGACATALSMATCELLVTLVLLYAIGRRAFDRRNVGVVAKTLGVCAAVTALHLGLGRLGEAQGLDTSGLPFGLARMVLDGLAYLCLILLTRAVRLDELVGLVRMARNRRSLGANAA